MKQYPIFIEHPKKATEAYSIYFPDFPGCFSAADDELDILKNAREALQLHIEELHELPEPTALSELKPKAGCYIAMVDVDASLFNQPKRRVNVMLSEQILKLIDEHSSNRSEFLERAARASFEKRLRL